MAFPRGPPSPPAQIAATGGGRRGGRGPRAPGAAGGGWRRAFRGSGGSGGAARAQPSVTVRRGQGRGGVSGGGGSGGRRGSLHAVGGWNDRGAGTERRRHLARGRGSQAPKGGGERPLERDEGPRANVTRGSGVTRADPGKRDPGLRGYPAKRDQGAPGDPGKPDKEGPPGKTPGGASGGIEGAWGG